MKILNVIGTAVAYMLAGISFMTGMWIMGIIWTVFGIANQFITMMW